MRLRQKPLAVELAQGTVRVEQAHQRLHVANVGHRRVQRQLTQSFVWVSHLQVQAAAKAQQGTLLPDQSACSI